MFACPVLEGFSEHWVGYTSDFPLLPLPKLQQQQIPNHPKMLPTMVFFLESCFREIMTPQRDGGRVPLLCPVKPKHMHPSITGTSGTVIFVPGSLLLPPKHPLAPQDHVCVLSDAKCTQNFPCPQTSELLDVVS